MKKNQWMHAYAPASVANVGSGFDILGYSLDGLGDWVSAQKNPDRSGAHVCEISGLDQDQIPLDARINTAAVAAQSLLNRARVSWGVDLKIKKEIPMSSGLGGSAASAVAAVVAVNALFDKSFKPEELLSHALDGEAVASGSRHADNVAPSLFGGLVLLSGPRGFLKIKVPAHLYSVVVHPQGFRIQTREARQLLKPTIELALHSKQSARLASLLLGCQHRKIHLIAHGLEDLIITPQRKQLLPYFDKVHAAALGAGALGCSISGSGPALFAWAWGAKSAVQIRRSMLSALKTSGFEGQGWVHPVNSRGARRFALPKYTPKKK